MRALGAERSTAREDGTAVLAVAAGTRSTALEQLLELAEFGVDALQLGRLLHQDLEPDVIADRHLIEQATELRLHEREALRQPFSLGLELAVHGRGARRHGGDGPASEEERLRHGTE